jgi:ribonuclease P protein component
VSPCRRASATNREAIASCGSEPAGRELRKTPAAVPSSTAVSIAARREPRSPVDAGVRLATPRVAGRDWRLHKHADYQRVYQSSRKQFSSLMSYFAAAQPPYHAGAGPRIGITAGKVLGKAVERNRIKRRMRAAIVSNLEALHAEVDLVLHPKRNVLDAEWTALVSDVRRVFERVSGSMSGSMSGKVQRASGEEGIKSSRSRDGRG